MPAPASHMIATAILDDERLALGALLHVQPAHQLVTHHQWWSVSGAVGPLVLAEETHQGVEASIGEAETLRTRTFDLDFRWVQLVVLKSTPFDEDGLQLPHLLGER